jgi:hypothetical protein
MAENIVTNSNDVEVVLERLGEKVGTSEALGRMIVDDFTLTREEDDSLVHGLGFAEPGGLTNGDRSYSFSFTMMGSDTNAFDIISDSDGASNVFSLTARKVAEDGTIEWEYALGVCKATTEEIDLSTGDAMEYPVEGIGFRYERVI